MELGKEVNNFLCHLQGAALSYGSSGLCCVPNGRGSVNNVGKKPCTPVLEPTRKSTYRNVAFINVTRECFCVIFCPARLLITLKLDTVP
jgi:hypothetical protein